MNGNWLCPIYRGYHIKSMKVNIKLHSMTINVKLTQRTIAYKYPNIGLARLDMYWREIMEPGFREENQGRG